MSDSTRFDTGLGFVNGTVRNVTWVDIAQPAKMFTCGTSYAFADPNPSADTPADNTRPHR